MVATATVVARTADRALDQPSVDTYLRKLIVWADSFDGILDDKRPPKPPIVWAGADDAANTARVTAYTKAAALWRAKHDRWQAANMKRKAQRRAERDGERDWAEECRARRQRRLKVPEPHPHPCAHAHAYEHSYPCPRIRAGALERRRPRRAGPTAAGRRAGRGRAARRRMRACMDSARAVLSGAIRATAVAARLAAQQAAGRDHHGRDEWTRHTVLG